MCKKFFSNYPLLIYILVFALISTICTVLFFVLDNAFIREILLIFAILLWCCTITISVALVFNLWIVEIDDKGILYRNIFKFRKFKRFFTWNEIYEVEVIPTPFFFLKRICFTTEPSTFWQKCHYATMKAPDVILVNTAKKILLTEIQKYYQKEIIIGRTFKNTNNMQQ